MNNTWGSEHYNVMMPMMMGNMGMPMNVPVNQMPQNMMGMVPVPPMGVMADWNQMSQQNAKNFESVVETNKADGNDNQRVDNDKPKSKSKVRDRSEIGRGRSTERSRDRNEHNKDKNEGERRRARDRQNKWDEQQSDTPTSEGSTSNINVPGNVIQINPAIIPMDMNMRFMSGMPGEMGIKPQMTMGQMKHPIYLSTAVLIPTLENLPRSDRPKRCRSILVSGLPDLITIDLVKEIFQRFGSITDVKEHKRGVFIVQFERQESVEQACMLSGYVFKLYSQMHGEGNTVYIDYARTRDDKEDYDRNKYRGPSPRVIEPCTQSSLLTLAEKIKKDGEFSKVAPTLTGWLERGECNKRNANTFYTIIQAANNQIHRLYNEKMQIDEEYQSLKASMKDKFAQVLSQFEQVAKILSVAKHQRVSDHFSKQQRRNIDIWLKMTEDLENMKEEFNSCFDDEDTDRSEKDMVPLERYEELKAENHSLIQELDGYKNEAHLAKTDAERRFEKFKAHFIAQQALEKNKCTPVFAIPNVPAEHRSVIPTSTSEEISSSTPPPQHDAKLISILTAYLLSHPHGATLDNIVSYVQNLIPNTNQTLIHSVLKKYTDLFELKIKNGARWNIVVFERLKES